jgi:GrpB-like predicted nucleotidyltransferase (UPF0157 family)
VRVVEHDPGWSALFARERVTLQQRLADLVTDIQHVGSTAVPDLLAKPILDIAMAIPALDLIPDIAEKLTEIFYIYHGDTGEDGGHLFVKDSEPDTCTVHLHVVEISDRQWANYLAFRQALREDETLRNRYAEIKLDLARRYANDRESYTSAKDEFIRGVLDQIVNGQPPFSNPPAGHPSARR